MPIGFGAILTNIPLADLMGEEGFLRTIYNMGVANELFPLLIFIGIGAMTDFGPLLENPKIFLLGAAGQFGIFLTIGLALLFGFDKLDAVAKRLLEEETISQEEFESIFPPPYPRKTGTPTPTAV